VSLPLQSGFPGHVFYCFAADCHDAIFGGVRISLTNKKLVFLQEKSSCPEEIEFITDDLFVQHTNITIIYN
jgi:hypothetical protein